jgi:hypothetical protein
LVRRRNGRSKSAPPTGSRGPRRQIPPSLHHLDQFSRADLNTWRRKSEALQEYASGLFDDLEAQRRTHDDALREAIRSVPLIRISLEGWGRIVEYQYTLDPLSPVGSQKNIGGRFNFGEDIDPNLFEPFRALYLAETEAVARAERFGVPTANQNGLTVEELALQNIHSHTYVRVRGNVDSVFDLTTSASLKTFIRATRDFSVSRRVVEASARARIPTPPYVIHNADELMRTLMRTDWRIEPSQFNRPSNSQAFGDLVRRCGIEAILYRSAKTEGSCLAVFLENFSFSSSFVELADVLPQHVVVARVDRSNCKPG